MKSIYDYQKHTGALIDDLSKAKQSHKLVGFIDKYKIWDAFYTEVLKKCSERPSPKIHSLIASSKIVTLCGMAENFIESKDDDVQRYRSFLGFLNPEEKLLFSLAFNCKPSLDREASVLQEKYLQTGDEAHFRKLLDLTSKRDDEYHIEVGNIMQAFIDDNMISLEKFFKVRIDLLYGVRSKIVHEGSPDVISSLLLSSSDAVMFCGSKGNTFFTIRYPIEEFFIRAVARATGNELPVLDPSTFLWQEYISQHGLRIARIANKLKGL